MSVFQPQQFGKYQLLDKIATGGMAELYRAKLTRAEGFEKLIAIKKILPHLSCEGELVKAFVDEAKLAALLQHENIVQIYDFGNLEGEYFIAMEFLFGKDLRSIIRKAEEQNMSIGFENTLYLVSQICAGLDYSHNLRDLQGKPLNIIHRDINPQNIFITYEGQVKLIDYGIAKAASHNTTTHEGLIKGKLAYMSPEQANGEIIDHRSDIFSTGIILYELLANKRMFEGEALQVYPKVRDALYEPPENVISDVPTKFYDLLNQALAKEREDRYQSAGDMLADLEECMYLIDARPNTRSFGQFIKSLFEEEFAAEELTLWAKSQIFSAGEELEPEQSTETERFGKTVVLPGMPPARKQHTGTWRLALVVGLIILGMIVDLTFNKVPSTQANTEGSLHAVHMKPSVNAIADEKILAAKAALETQEYSLALRLFDEALSSAPARIESVSEFYVRALHSQAANLVESDTEQAKAMLLKALDLDPDNISGLTQLGFIHVEQKDYANAIVTFQKVSTIKPDFAHAYFNLGYLYWATEDYAQAKEMYQRVIELKPEFVDEALFNLAMIQNKLGEQSQCIKNLEQAIAINPDNESARAYLQKLKGGSKSSNES